MERGGESKERGEKGRVKRIDGGRRESIEKRRRMRGEKRRVRRIKEGRKKRRGKRKG